MTVRVPTAEIERAVAARLAQVGKTAKLKGFRPGKVPQKVVRQYYGGQVRDEVMTDVIRSTYSRAIAEQNLNPAGGPRIEPLAGRRRHGEHFTYRATFEVYPEIALQPLDELAVEVPTRRRSKTRDVDAMIDKLRSQRADLACGRAQGGRGRSRRRRLHRHDRRRAVRRRAGQRHLDRASARARCSRISTARSRRGKPARARRRRCSSRRTIRRRTWPARPPNSTSTCTASRSGVLPELDDAFAASFGLPAAPTSLRGEVRTNMERELTERLKAETKTRGFDALIERESGGRAACARRAGDQQLAGGCVAADGQQRRRARRRRASVSRASRSGASTVGSADPRTSERAQDQARSDACRSARQGAGGALRKTRRGRTVLPQRPWHDGSGRSFGARGSGRGFSARARQRYTTKTVSFKDFMGA